MDIRMRTNDNGSAIAVSDRVSAAHSVFTPTRGGRSPPRNRGAISALPQREGGDVNCHSLHWEKHHAHFFSFIAVIVAVTVSSGATAAEITLIAPGGIRAAIEEMIPAFEKKTGNTVKATFGSGNGTKQRVVKGDAFDVPVVQPPYPDVLASGNVVKNSETPLAHVSVGVAVRPGTPHPDISSAGRGKENAALREIHFLSGSQRRRSGRRELR